PRGRSFFCSLNAGKVVCILNVRGASRMPLPGPGRPRFNRPPSSGPEKPASGPPPAPPPTPQQDFRRPIFKKRRVIRAQASSGVVLLCLACAQEKAAGKGIALVLLVFFAHSVAAMAVAVADPGTAPRLLPGAGRRGLLGKTADLDLRRLG